MKKLIYIILFVVFNKVCETRHMMEFDEKTFSRSMDICVVTPIYYSKNREFWKDSLHKGSIYIVGVDNEADKLQIERNTHNETVFIYHAADHISDSLFALYKGAVMCREASARFMFIFEMDLKFERNTEKAKNITREALFVSLHDLLKEHSMPFWMLGSEYMGPLSIAHPEHLNGNAVYDLGSYCFALAMHFLLTKNSGGNGYDVFLINFVRDAHPICKKTYSSTPRICNYWRVRSNMTNDSRCWFVHY